MADITTTTDPNDPAVPLLTSDEADSCDDAAGTPGSGDVPYN